MHNEVSPEAEAAFRRERQQPQWWFDLYVNEYGLVGDELTEAREDFDMMLALAAAALAEPPEVHADAEA